MSVDRSELADILAEATGWSVTAGPSSIIRRIPRGDAGDSLRIIE